MFSFVSFFCYYRTWFLTLFVFRSDNLKTTFVIFFSIRIPLNRRITPTAVEWKTIDLYIRTYMYVHDIRYICIITIRCTPTSGEILVNYTHDTRAVFTNIANLITPRVYTHTRLVVTWHTPNLFPRKHPAPKCIHLY